MRLFNKPFNRANTASHKWSHPHKDIISFSIADSDYPTAKPIIKALKNRIKHGAFGYTLVDDEYRDILKDWVNKKYNYNIEKKWIVTSPSVVTSLFYLINSLTSEKAKVIIQSPVYNPFYNVVTSNNRILIENKLINDNNNYSIDFLDLEAKFQDDAQMFIFCSPHNPVGRVYTYQEIERVVNLCKKYDIILVSDEIHCDLILNNNQFTSVGRFIGEYDKMIICTAPSKTFNLAGLQLSNMFISNKDYRKIMYKTLSERSLREPNVLAITACKAAYSKCDKWLAAQINHIENNYLFLKNYFKEFIKDEVITNLEGTYLVWVDFRYLKMTSKEIVDSLIDYKIVVNSGTMYGTDYDGYIRINIACSKGQLKKGLDAINRFVKERK